MLHIKDWASWIRTSECSSQSAVPYRLAIAQRRRVDTGIRTLASRATIWRANQLRYTHHSVPEGIRTPDPGLEGRCSIQLSYEHISVC